MARHRTTIDVSRPPGEAFDHLSHLRTATRWDRAVTRVTELSEGPASEGLRRRLESEA